jgi:predicted DNA binding CopG/RHH family protein
VDLSPLKTLVTAAVLGRSRSGASLSPIRFIGLFTMPVLKTLVDTEIKTRFKNIAKAQGLSESELLRAVALVVTGQDNSADQLVKPDAEKSDLDRMTVRMPRFLLEAIDVQAKTKGMAPSRWVASLVQSHLTDQPVMTDDELAALKASNRELAAIGRNINQIAKVLNETFYETEQVKLDKLAELSQTIEKNRETVRALVRASQNSWKAD